MSRRFVKNSLFGTIAAVASTLAAFLSGLIVARVLGVSGIGAYAFVVWIVSVTTAVTGVGLPLTLTRYLPDFDSTDRGTSAEAFAAYWLRPAAFINSLPFVIFVLYAIWLQTGAGAIVGGGRNALADPLLCILAGACCTAQSMGDFVKGYLRGRREFGRSAKLVVVAAIAQILAILVGSLAFGVRGAMAGYLLGAALPLLALRDFWGVAPGVDVEMRGRVVNYAKFRWISEIAGVFVFSRIEVLFVQIFWGVESVGLLTASLTLANLAVQGPLMLTWGVLPHLTDQFNRKEMEGLRASYCAGTRLMGFLIFPACFGLAALVPELLPRLYGSSFERAVPSAVILVCAASISATATIGANVLWAVERTDVDLYLSAIGAALSVAGGFLLIAPLGIVGAALSRAIAQFVVIGAGLWFLHARLGFQIPLAALGKLSVASLLCSATAYVVLLFVHGYPGMTLAIGAGAFVYLAAVRLLKALEPSDLESLRGLAQYLPSSFWGSAALKVMTFALG